MILAKRYWMESKQLVELRKILELFQPLNYTILWFVKTPRGNMANPLLMDTMKSYREHSMPLEKR